MPVCLDDLLKAELIASSATIILELQTTSEEINNWKGEREELEGRRQGGDSGKIGRAAAFEASWRLTRVLGERMVGGALPRANYS